jgi:hypothetical protein
MNAQVETANVSNELISFTHVVQERVKEAGQEKGKNVEVGKVSYLVPTLQAFGIPAEGPKTDDDGDLVYENKISQWIWEAIQSAVKSQLISFLQPKSVELKEGCKLWNTVGELVAGSSAVSQKGATLKLRADFKAAWAAYITGLKKSPAVTAAFIALVSDFPTKGKDCALSVSSAGNKAAVARHLTAFLDGLSEADQEKFGDIVADFAAICTAEEQDLSAE